LARRVASNPTYYDSEGTRDECLSRIVDKLDDSIIDHSQDRSSAIDTTVEQS